MSAELTISRRKQCSNAIPAGMESDDDENDVENFFGYDKSENRSNDDVESVLENGNVVNRETARKEIPKKTPRSFNSMKQKPKAHAFHMKKEKIIQNNDLHSVLESVNCGEYFPLFCAQKIDLPLFLTLGDDDLEKIGIQELDARRRLMQAILEIHRRPWHESSLILPKTDLLSCIDATQIISNIHAHVACMESSLMYVRRRYLTDNKDPSLVTDVDKDNLRKLINEVDDTIKSVGNFEKEMKVTAVHIKKLKVDRRTGAVEKISAESDEKESSKFVSFAFLLTAAVGIFVIFKMVIKKSNLN